MVNIVVVSGDAGSFRVQEPVVKILLAKGADIWIVAEDGDMAKAKDLWKKSKVLGSLGIHLCLPLDSSNGDAQEYLTTLISEADLALIGTCGKAYHLENLAFEISDKSGTVSVAIPDGYYNHRHPHFAGISPCWWLAINKAHQRDVMIKHNINNDRQVPITGNSQFDELLEVRKNSQEIRDSTRKDLILKNSNILVTWWAPSHPERVLAQLGFIMPGLAYLSKMFDRKVCFSARIHPTFDSFFGKNSSQSENLHNYINRVCASMLIRYVPTNQIGAEIMAFASDVTMGPMTTTPCSIAPILGRPTLHLFNLQEEEIAEEMGLEIPYSMEAEVGATIPVFKSDEVGPSMAQALDPLIIADLQKAANENLELVEKSAEKTADFVMSLL